MIPILQSLIKTATKSSDIHVFRYSCTSDYDMLWAQIETPSASFDCSTVVILYDGQPGSDRSNTAFHPEDWLSPWDWAIGQSILLSRTSASIPAGGFRCFVIDLLPAYWGTSARVRFKAISGITPWLRWYVPMSGRQVAVHEFSVLFHDLLRLSELPSLNSAVLLAPEWRMFAQTWASFFVSPGHRHAIGNLIGPLLLAEGLGSKQGSTIPITSSAVTRRFQSLLLTVGSGSVDNRLTTTEVTKEPPLLARVQCEEWSNRGSMRLVLVDDQYDLGYHTILAHLLFGDEYQEVPCTDGNIAKGARTFGDVRIRSTGSPGVLLQWIQNAVREVEHESDWFKPRVLGHDEVDLLCLDLRLFPDSTADYASNNEQDFLRKLLAIVPTLKLPIGRYPELQAALEAARRRANGGGEELAGLCLLPLLISLLDPSLPVVLFSSTHQRDVTDLLRNRPSIICKFTKPIITGYLSADLAQQCASDLEIAVSDALRLYGVRIIWRLIVDLARILRGKPCRIVEPVVSPKSGAVFSYTLDVDMISILAGEYQNLFLYGRFADALQIPDNLLEHIGGKFHSPGILEKMDVMFIDGLRDAGKPWDDALLQAYLSNDTRKAASNVVKNSIYRLAEICSDEKLKHSLKKLAKSIGNFYQAGILNLKSFAQHHGRVTTILCAYYGTLENLVAKALNDSLDEVVSQGLHPIAQYQFYALIAAMRNARSHFKCRPVQHDAELQPIAVWLWGFFLVGLKSLATGQAAIIAKPTTLNDLRQARKSDWLPTSSLPDESEGSEFCFRVICRFGHLLRLGILDVSSELQAYADFARKLAQSAAA